VCLIHVNDIEGVQPLQLVSGSSLQLYAMSLEGAIKIGGFSLQKLGQLDSYEVVTVVELYYRDGVTVLNSKSLLHQVQRHFLLMAQGFIQLLFLRRRT